MGPWVVSAVKLGASLLILNDMTTSFALAVFGTPTG